MVAVGDIIDISKGKYQGLSGEVKKVTAKQVVVALDGKEVRVASNVVKKREVSVKIGQKRSLTSDDDGDDASCPKKAKVQQPAQQPGEQLSTSNDPKPVVKFPLLPQNTDPLQIDGWLRAAVQAVTALPSDMTRLCVEYMTVDLIQAALNEDTETIQEYAEEDLQDTNNECDCALTLVFAAIRKRHLDLLRAALNRPGFRELDYELRTMDLDEMIDDEVTVRTDMLAYAAEIDSADSVPVILESGLNQSDPASHYSCENHGMSAFHVAAWYGNPNTLKVLIDKGLPVAIEKAKERARKYSNTVPENVPNPLNYGTNEYYGWQGYCCSDMDCTPIACALIGVLARHKQPDRRKDRERAHECVKLLLAAGADVNRPTGPVAFEEPAHKLGVFSEGPANRWHSWTPLHLAVLLKDPAIVATLLKAGADQFPVEEEMIPLEYPSGSRYWSRQRKYKRLFSGCELMCRRLWLPIHFAVAAVAAAAEPTKEQEEIVQLLLPKQGQEIKTHLPVLNDYHQHCVERFHDSYADETTQTLDTAFEKLKPLMPEDEKKDAMEGCMEDEIQKKPADQMQPPVEWTESAAFPSPPTDLIDLAKEAWKEIHPGIDISDELADYMLRFLRSRLQKAAQASVECANQGAAETPPPEGKEEKDVYPFAAVKLEEATQENLWKYCLQQVRKEDKTLEAPGKSYPVLFTNYIAGVEVKQECQDHLAVLFFARAANYILCEVIEVTGNIARDGLIAFPGGMDDLQESAFKENDDENDDDKSTGRPYQLLCAVQKDEELCQMFLPSLQQNLKNSFLFLQGSTPISDLELSEDQEKQVKEAKENFEKQWNKMLVQMELDSVPGLREWTKATLQSLTTSHFEESFLEYLPGLFSCSPGLNLDQCQKIFDQFSEILSNTEDLETEVVDRVIEGMESLAQTNQLKQKLVTLKLKMKALGGDDDEEPRERKELLLELGDILQCRGDLDDALRVYDKVLEEGATQEELVKQVILGKGEVFCCKGDSSAAVTYFKQFFQSK